MLPKFLELLRLLQPIKFSAVQRDLVRIFRLLPLRLLPLKISHLLQNLLVHLAIFSLLFEQLLFVSTATAQVLPITPDGATNTQVTKTASGIDQINIAAPNSSGMSHNTFTDYNVNQSGQILNNFSGHDSSQIVGGSGAGAVTQTAIGGLVTVNQNLQHSGSARIILNEVTSTNNSQLLGYTEVAGSKAEIIIANSNGITCRGCGFIQTSKLHLIAGRSNFDQNGNPLGGELGFDLAPSKINDTSLGIIPLITVEGLGLDVEQTSSADIVASSIKLLSTIYGSSNSDVTLKSGEGRYNFQTKEIASSNNSSGASPSQELFAIDASNISSVQA